MSAVVMQAAQKLGGAAGHLGTGRIVLRSEKGTRYAEFRISPDRTIVYDARTGERISTSRPEGGRILHFDHRGDSIGYSQISRDGQKLNHYDVRGNLVGFDELQKENRIVSYLTTSTGAVLIAESILPRVRSSQLSDWTVPIVLMGVDVPERESETVRKARRDYFSSVGACQDSRLEEHCATTAFKLLDFAEAIYSNQYR